MTLSILPTSSTLPDATQAGYGGSPVITAHEVATELRKLADSLDKQPEAVVRKAWVSFYCDRKDEFLNTARLLPRPVKKSENHPERPYSRIKLEYMSDAMDAYASIEKSKTCELIEPAKPAVYRCAPILSDEEESGVSA